MDVREKRSEGAASRITVNNTGLRLSPSGGADGCRE